MWEEVADRADCVGKGADLPLNNCQRADFCHKILVIGSMFNYSVF